MRRLDALLSKPYQPSYELYFLSHKPKSGFMFSEPVVPFDWAGLKQKGIQYVLFIDALHSERDLFFQALPANADRLATFSPYRDSRDLTLHDPQAMTGGPFLWKDILARSRGGYPVSIYRVRS